MREIWADNAKVIGIFLMVLGHNALANDGVFDFIYSFHMPTHDYSMLLAFPMTVMVLICHLPIIYLLNHKFPFLIGKSKKNESYESNTYRSW